MRDVQTLQKFMAASEAAVLSGVKGRDALRAAMQVMHAVRVQDDTVAVQLTILTDGASVPP